MSPNTEYIGDEAPEAVTMTTYKNADGSHVAGEYAYVTDMAWWEEDDWIVPTEVIRQEWVQTEAERFWFLPPIFGECEIEDAEPCEEDAYLWLKEPNGGPWMRVCHHHSDQLLTEGWTTNGRSADASI